MTPHVRPSKPGDACWDVDYADRMLSPISQVGADAIDWFLATHSPIACEDSAGPLTQRELFQQLFASTRPETLVVVKGSQGTGKSQLINWLKLRFDDAAHHESSPGAGALRLRNVLIRRRSGSLKDALEQLVAQLPEYGQYLDKIRAAIDGVSGEAAQRRLYAEMHLSLFAIKADAPKRVRSLDEVFNDNGTVRRLCRSGGAIDKNIRRLTEQSNTADRETLPPFLAADFEFAPNARVSFDEDLKLRLQDDEDVRQRCADHANSVLRQAIAGLTGLRGHTLHEIFRSIRAEMGRRGEVLAIFIEDVSTLSVLDEELVNALQPQNDPELCPLVGVMGMTEPAYDRLPDNLRERVSRVVTLTQDSGFRDSDSIDGATDLFVARYLNALRAGPEQIGTLADDVRHHEEQRRSACTECTIRDQCFSAFGSVRLGESEVGLYPLSSGAAWRLLDGQNDEALLRTPRTLLQHVVLELLKKVVTGFQGPSIGLAVQPRSPQDLASEGELMLGGWSADQRSRLSYLLYYWTGMESLSKGAAPLQPMLPWFRHSPFNKVADSPRPAQPATPARQSAPPEPAPPSPKYEDAIRRLDEWFQQGQALKTDTEFRNLLVGVIKNSLPLEEVRVPSEAMRKRSKAIDASNVEIEGGRSPAVSTKAKFGFRRSQAVYDLLKDLVAFKHLGQDSWRFAGGAEARRRYAAWLEANSGELVQSYDVGKSDRAAALGYGIRFLRLAYRFTQRKDLPSETAASVRQIVEFTPEAVATYSQAAQTLAADLPQRVRELRDEVLEELAVRQGGGGLNFIDPCLLVEHLSRNPSDTTLGEIDGDAVLRDYPSIGKLAKTDWARLDSVLEKEHAGLREKVQSLESLLRHWGISAEPLQGGVKEYLECAREVIKACEAAKHTIGDVALQAQILGLTAAKITPHVAAVENAIRVLEQDASSVLSLDFGDLNKTVDFIVLSDKAMRSLDDRLSHSLGEVLTEGDVTARCQDAVDATRRLSEFTTVEPNGKEGPA